MERITTERFFNSADRMSTAHSLDATLLRLTVLEVGEVESDRETVIDVESIHYCVSGFAALKGRIEASWADVFTLRPGSIYVRTAQRVYRTYFRQLASLLERLPSNFVQVNHGVAVNEAKIEVPDIGRQLHQRVGLPVAARPGDRPVEWVVVGRRHVAGLRYRLGIPKHARRKVRSEGPLPRARSSRRVV